MALVSLTFDDGVDADLDTVIPVLDRHRVRGTFFIAVGGACFARRHAEWREAALRGHELGNHTIFHPMDTTHAGVTDGNALENYSLDRMRLELAAASNVLAMLDARSARTFAFPCNNPWVGTPGLPRRALRRMRLDRTRLMSWVDTLGLDVFSGLADYTPVVRELFAAARFGTTSVANLPVVPEDRHRIRGVEPAGRSADELLGLVDAAVARGCWLPLVFHAVGDSQPLSCDRSAFEALVERVSSDPRVEVLPFVEAAARLLPRN
jgi:hypothetical protein